jgi:hypothetical protein
MAMIETAGELEMEHAADAPETVLRAGGLSEPELADWFGSGYRGPDALERGMVCPPSMHEEQFPY